MGNRQEQSWCGGPDKEVRVLRPEAFLGPGRSRPQPNREAPGGERAVDVRPDSNSQSSEVVRSAQPRADLGTEVTGLQCDTFGVLIETEEEIRHP